MERPVFNNFSNLKVSPKAAESLKKLEPTKQQVQGTNYLKVLNSKHIYAGTVTPKEIARRRTKNKLARKSRRKNRN